MIATPRKVTVPVEVLQQAFDSSGKTMSEVARAYGYKKRPKPHHGEEVGAVQRMIGRMTEHSRGSCRHRERVHYSTAVRFIEACGFDPVDFGL